MGRVIESKLSTSGRHLPAVLRAPSARLGASLHIADTFAIVGAGLAHLGADPASQFVSGRIPKHEVDGGRTDVDAVEHKAEVSGLHMFATQFQAMGGCHVQADVAATAAYFNTGLKVFIDMAERVHDNSPRIVCGLA